MAGISNLLLVVLNVLTTLLGIAVAGFGAWLQTKSSETCLQAFHTPILVFGVFVAAISILALVSAFFKIGILLRIYLLFMLVLILACIAFAIFSFVITHKSAAQAVSKIGYKQYHIADYSNWLQDHIEDPSIWLQIRACLRDSGMCFYSYASNTAFLSSVVNYLAADTFNGCCGPPDVCGYTESNGQYSSPTNSGADPDCSTYNNAIDTRCFDCNACPAGVMESIVTNWKKLAIAIAILAAFLILIYCIGCQAL
ncbi:hypothetical protein KP509_17G009700 [Ceratopteris richardii]|uniref:Tetraspanin n=1 Tax=Ceratopteris richardii TaxID=49495 RepID=A0A8T2SVU1_CERRI|nr:hypothetical protein KP509_1Z251900 [Ceratopteris richardii]KAH7372556.1 hypothetical protein KP509_17G009700 [Ceratopteris richardii]